MQLSTWNRKFQIVTLYFKLVFKRIKSQFKRDQYPEVKKPKDQQRVSHSRTNKTSANES